MQFSVILTKVVWTGQKLKLSYKRKSALFFISLFLLACVALLMSQDFPRIIQFSISFAILILIWALVDIYKSQAFLIYTPSTNHLHVRAKKNGRLVAYNGAAKGKLRLEKHLSINTDFDQDRFNILITFFDKKARLPFLLESFAYSFKDADSKINEWNKKLNL